MNTLYTFLAVLVGILWVEYAEPKKRHRYSLWRQLACIVGVALGITSAILWWRHNHWWVNAIIVVWVLTMTSWVSKWNDRKDTELGIKPQ